MKRILTSAFVAALLSAANIFAQTNSAPAAKGGFGPGSALIPAIRATPTNWLARHEGFVAQAKKGGGEILFMGDSITDNWRSKGLNVWNKYYAPQHAANFGIGGDRTQHVLWRIEHGELDGIKPRVAVLMIGTNNSNSDPADDIAKSVKLIIDAIRARIPDTKILLLAIFPRNKPTDKPGQMEKIHQVNGLIASYDNGRTVKFLANSAKYRPLGIGYANLGAALMQWGLPYDSEAGRAMAAAITALMTGEAYAESARIAATKGTFDEYPKNRDPMLRVVRKHREALNRVPQGLVPTDLVNAAQQAWDDALKLGEEYGFRNSQVSLLAPTGTIGFKMDCDTTGIEPDMAIVKYKNLVGGGKMKIVNQSVAPALRKLGYTDAQVQTILAFVDQKDTVEGAPGLKDEHLAVFDCAFKPANGERCISVAGHVRMMAAVQPFLSGAISKTVNMPAEATVDDVMKTYLDAWRMGLKSIALYRDGSKKAQPVVLTKGKDGAADVETKPDDAMWMQRRRLPDERQSITHKFSIAGLDGYITVGMYEDGKPGEIFITMAKQGSVISGLMDSFATSISIALQYGVPVRVLVDKFTHVRFEPSGFSTNPAIGYAKSIVDYVFRWMSLKFLSPAERADRPSQDLEDASHADMLGVGPAQNDLFQGQQDAPPCSSCGFVMVRSGSCYKCMNCGSTSGCS